MWKKLISAVLCAAILSSYIFTVYAEDKSLRGFSAGQEVNGFTVTDTRTFKVYKSDLITFEHNKTGAKVLFIANSDKNRVFDIAFRTPAEDNRGIPHVFEHSTLSGSVNYPSDTLWMKLSKQTYNTYMNAQTSQNNTDYPVSSLSESQLYLLSDYYLDCVFNPLIYTDDSICGREAWHYELDNPDGELKISGTVYSEVQGTSGGSPVFYNINKTLYPKSFSENNCGGDIAHIPEITNEDLKNYHSKYYHPSNSLTLLYGDLDAEKFLKLLDGYFSQYEKEKINVDFGSYKQTEDYTEGTYVVPVSNNDDQSDYVSYALECTTADSRAMAYIGLISVVMNHPASYFQKRAAYEFPDVSMSCTTNTTAPKPYIAFTAKGLKSENKDKFVALVKEAIENMKTQDIDSALKDALSSAIRRMKLQFFEGSNVGTQMAMDISAYWANTNDVHYYFDYTTALFDGINIAQNTKLNSVASQHLNLKFRQAVVTTVPSPGLYKTEQDEYKAKLALIKENMSNAEKDALVQKTKEYRQKAENSNDEKDNEFIKKLSVKNYADDDSGLKKYDIKESMDNAVRYVNAVADMDEFGKGRIMIDMSDVSPDELGWLSLYCMLLGSFRTELYSVEEIMLNTSRYANGSFDIVTLKADNQNGFTPYLIFKYDGYAEESDIIFEIADQLMFKSDFNNVDTLEYAVNSIKTSVENDISANGYNYMRVQAEASSDLRAAYQNKMIGMDFLQFMSDVCGMFEKGQEKSVIKQLENIQKKVNNKYGAMIVYAGSEKSIEKNNAEAVKFFKNIPYEKKTPADYTSIRTAYENNALKIDSNVNYNGIYAPNDVLKIEYDGRTDVAMTYINDRFLIPELRNKHNVYSVINNQDESGISIISYRDPRIDTTFETYSALGNMIKADNITQEMVDNYILSVYSQLTMPKGELHDAYWAAADYTDGISYESKLQKLKEVQSVTAEDIKAYADVMNRLGSDGILFTAGNAGMIDSNKNFYDTIFSKNGAEKNPDRKKKENPVHIENETGGIMVVIDAEILNTDTPPVIMNDRVLAPMRNIFEGLGADVEWNAAERMVTAVKNGKVISLTIDSDVITVTDESGSVSEIKLDCPAVIMNDYTMIPLRAVSETLGCEVKWDGENQAVYIKNAA